MPRNERLTEALLRVTRLIRRNANSTRRAEITPEQYWLLKRVNRLGPMSVGALADGLGLTSASVTVACKRLEKAGLLTRARQPDTGDERVVLVALTDAGLGRIEAWQEERRVFIEGLLTGLSEPEQDQLLHLLERVLAGTELALDTPAESQPVKEGG